MPTDSHQPRRYGFIGLEHDDFYNGWPVKSGEVNVTAQGYPSISTRAHFASAEDAESFLEMNRDEIERRCGNREGYRGLYVGWVETGEVLKVTAVTKIGENLNISSEWTLHGANITAVAHRGRVYNERDLDLLITEGRHEQLHPREEGDNSAMREVWDYQLNFYEADGLDPESSEQTECLVAIVGTLPDGRQCKIHGTGFVGRDNHCQIEGTFFRPPVIEIAGPDDDLMEWDRPPE